MDGKGRIRDLEHPAREFEVSFTFKFNSDLLSDISRRRPALKAVAHGEVVSIDGQAVPIGLYRLSTDRGEVYCVKHSRTEGWSIVDPARKRGSLSVRTPS